MSDTDFFTRISAAWAEVADCASEPEYVVKLNLGNVHQLCGRCTAVVRRYFPEHIEWVRSRIREDA